MEPDADVRDDADVNQDAEPDAEPDVTPDADMADDTAPDAEPGTEPETDSEPGTQVVGLPLLQALSEAKTLPGVSVDLAEAVAIVDAERMHSELEKWQMVADERERSLGRADLALDTVARAVEAAAIVAQTAGDLNTDAARRREGSEPPPSTNVQEDEAPAKSDAPQPAHEGFGREPVSARSAAQSGAAEIPPDIRAEARRYAEALRAAARSSRRRRWWDLRR